MIFSGGSLKLMEVWVTSWYLEFRVFHSAILPFCNHRSHNFWSLKITKPYDVKKHIFPVIGTLGTLCVKYVDVMKTVISSQTLAKTIELYSKLDCLLHMLHTISRFQKRWRCKWSGPYHGWNTSIYPCSISSMAIPTHCKITILQSKSSKTKRYRNHQKWFWGCLQHGTCDIESRSRIETYSI